MSSFAALVGDDSAEATAAAFDRMVAALEAGAPASARSLCRGTAAVACRSSRSEEVPALGDWVLGFDGRLDNRPELEALVSRVPGGPALNDSDLVLQLFATLGEGFVERLLGPFALVLVNGRTREALLARDALGDRTLFYVSRENRFLVGSSEAVTIAHADVSDELDPRRVLLFFANDVAHNGGTFFRGVRELLPGTVLRWSDGEVRSRRYWRPEAEVDFSLEEAAEEYRELLSRAISTRLSRRDTATLLMSGGLDSTSIAALGRQESDGGSSLRALSWIFPVSVDCDEGSFIEPVVRRLGIEATQFSGEDLGPDCEDSDLCSNPSGPEENPYRSLKNRAYREAASLGSRVVLTGGSADALYTGFERWALDLALGGRPFTAIAELAADLSRQGLRIGLRRAGLGVLRGQIAPPVTSAPWLTPWALERVADSKRSSVGERGSRIESIAGARPARSISLEAFHAARCGVELRHPYRDRRLVELMLRLPAYLLYREGRFKPIAREALAGRLPAAVLERSRPTLLTPLFEAAIRGPGRQAWTKLLRAPDAVWPRYVRRDFIDAALERSVGPQGDVALWNCLSFELWRRRFNR